jgi:hypothetical protein
MKLYAAIVVLSALSALTGCESLVGGRVISQASFDHRCPENQIRLTRHDGTWNNVEVNACGTARRYQCVGGTHNTPCAFVEEASTATRP